MVPSSWSLWSFDRFCCEFRRLRKWGGQWFQWWLLRLDEVHAIPAAFSCQLIYILILNWCPREVVGGNREGSRNEWCFWMIFEKTGHSQFTTSKRCDVMQPKGCHMHRSVSSTLSFLIWKSKKRIWPWLSWVPVIKKKLSQNPQVMEPSRWRNLKNWFLRPSWGAKKPQVVKRKNRPNKRGNFEVGGVHSHLPPIMGFVVILFDFVWLTIQTFFSLNYDYGEVGYIFQVAQVQCLPWQSFKGSERIRLFKSWLRSHPHTQKKQACICYLNWFWSYFRSESWFKEIRWFEANPKGFPKSWWWYRDIVFSHVILALQFHVCVTCATPSKVITMSGRMAEYATSSSNNESKVAHDMSKYLLH